MAGSEKSGRRTGRGIGGTENDMKTETTSSSSLKKCSQEGTEVENMGGTG